LSQKILEEVEEKRDDEDILVITSDGALEETPAEEYELWSDFMEDNEEIRRA